MLCVGGMRWISSSQIFDLRMPLPFKKVLGTPKSSCLCGLYLLVFTVLEIKTKFKNMNPLKNNSKSITCKPIPFIVAKYALHKIYHFNCFKHMVLWHISN